MLGPTVGGREGCHLAHDAARVPTYKRELCCRYSIDKLAKLGDFADSCYLLLHGELPNAKEKTQFTAEMCGHTLVNEQLVHFYKVLLVMCIDLKAHLIGDSSATLSQQPIL